MFIQEPNIQKEPALRIKNPNKFTKEACACNCCCSSSDLTRHFNAVSNVFVPDVSSQRHTK